MSKGKWLGAAAGWFFGGPIGAIIGYYIGKNVSIGRVDQNKAFEISLLVLSSAVIKADGKILNSELDYVKKFFIKTFGSQKSNQYFRIFNKLNKDDFSGKIRQICLQINSHINHSTRLEIIHFLFGVAFADNNIDNKEILIIKKIAGYLNINNYDFESIQSMFLSNNSSNTLERYFKILELPSSASDKEIKRAYRKMAIKYHPDKIQGVSDDIKKLAEEKFLLVKQAYEEIMKSRS
ncbi:MAG: molecular chaperone DjlA [Flavobacteriales bacterium]|nr:molecular chaperone DjlA [Flavobacteriales bacterium]|tara:strand:+ start:942 stop:1649 length:708 start_codon:yes stop_codon:yes gene_type:complete